MPEQMRGMKQGPVLACPPDLVGAVENLLSSSPVPPCSLLEQRRAADVIRSAEGSDSGLLLLLQFASQALARAVGLDDLQRSLLTPTVLGLSACRWKATAVLLLPAQSQPSRPLEGAVEGKGSS